MVTKTTPSSLRMGRGCAPGRTRRRKGMVQVHSQWHVETNSGWDVRPVSQPHSISSTYTDIPRTWQQMPGVNMKRYYAVYVFEMAGLTGTSTSSPPASKRQSSSPSLAYWSSSSTKPAALPSSSTAPSEWESTNSSAAA